MCSTYLQWAQCLQLNALHIETDELPIWCTTSEISNKADQNLNMACESDSELYLEIIYKLINKTKYCFECVYYAYSCESLMNSEMKCQASHTLRNFKLSTFISECLMTSNSFGPEIVTLESIGWVKTICNIRRYSVTMTKRNWTKKKFSSTFEFIHWLHSCLKYKTLYESGVKKSVFNSLNVLIQYFSSFSLKATIAYTHTEKKRSTHIDEA